MKDTKRLYEIFAKAESVTLNKHSRVKVITKAISVLLLICIFGAMVIMFINNNNDIVDSYNSIKTGKYKNSTPVYVIEKQNDSDIVIQVDSDSDSQDVSNVNN